MGAGKYKYALSNAKEGEYAIEELVQMQSSRLRRDGAFFSGCQTGGGDESLPGKGMVSFSPQADHMAMVMMALHFILSEKMLFKDTFPLLSAYDVREIMLNVYPRKGTTQEEIMDQIHKRHEQRRKEKAKKDSS